MRADRVITYIGIFDGLLLVGIWHGARFSLIDYPNMKSGMSYVDSVSDINSAQAAILIYTVAVVGVFSRFLFPIKSKVSSFFWTLMVAIVVVLGLTQSYSFSFVTLMGFGYMGLLLGLAPCVIASALLISLLAIDSPISLTRLWKGKT